ncbi:MAG: bifunctional N(6)-L-threonylcarbamoyladenine synthase/serine/threonine protein kinase [Promethearchaeota archaeon]
MKNSNVKKKGSRNICLGIESTAHTFGIGIIDFKGNVLSSVNDMYIPELGGLHPRKVVEHHNSIFLNVIQNALDNSGITISDVNLVAFSQGPGLGPVLRIGSAVARTLAQKLKIPIIGVNHCIGHVEIGRRICGAKDPLTLYVSGGNTIISAFNTGKYRIFGETLDLAIGNMIDMVGRELNLSHPGGPKIEKLAKLGGSNRYISLPYVIKGMDLSYSGLFTKCRNLIHSPNFNNEYSAEDIAYSLQETAFAMLTEVTERALAHTEKKEVLLTGGVAANKRLQDMIHYIADEHDAEFFTLPIRFAGDNGAMIAWTGVLYYLNKGGMKIKDTLIDPKWRMDEVFIPWRLPGKKFTGLESFKKSSFQSSRNIQEKKTDSNKLQISQECKKQDYKVINIGAEAELIKTWCFNRNVLIKQRLKKKYRICELDDVLRIQRTLNEAKTLIRIKKFKVPVPLIIDVDIKNAIIVMSYLDGIRLKDKISNLKQDELRSTFKKVGKYIARLHNNHQIHGDLTTSNIILMPNNNMFFIDFGLAYNSSNVEDKAVDLHLFKRVITSTHGAYFKNIFPPFIKGYIDEYGGEDGQKIVDEIEDVELRGRYVKKNKRKRGVIKK